MNDRRFPSSPRDSYSPRDRRGPRESRGQRDYGEADSYESVFRAPETGAFRAPSAAPRRPAAPAARVARQEIEATVKWFNAIKGFGFVSPTDGSGDAFLHATTVTAAGHQSLEPGTRVVCDLSEGPKGMQVAVIHSVEAPTGETVLASVDDHRGAGSVEGTVKFYNAAKGFGFVAPDDGSRDVFVSARTVEMSGMAALEPAQRIRMSVRAGDRGPMAVRIESL
jgi:CspA family cold shock protein